MPAERRPPPDTRFEWAVAERTYAGESRSGDVALITPRHDGTLVAVVDGLGHGGEAAAAAVAAARTLRAHSEDELPSMVQRCHDALRRTRGAVMAVLVAREDGTVTWTGVGNVDALVVRADGTPREHALMLGGVLGMQVPRVRAAQVTLEPGDEVILATDGIRRGFIDRLVVGPPQRTADYILREHATGDDDAMVVVGRYGGGGR